MKVILERDVAKLGRRFAIVTVPDGYALNKLIPQGMAKPATPENIKRVEAKASASAAHTAEDSAKLAATVAALTTTPLVLKADANAQDHLFKAVKMSDVSAAATALGHYLPESVLATAEPIKSLGTHEIAVDLPHSKTIISIMVERAA
jgi:large subunit ribosomal protein L9